MARIAVVALALLQVGCGELAKRAGLVTARELAGTKSGALEGVTVATVNDLDEKEKRVLVDVDILHDVTVEATGDFEVALSSDILPRIRATVLGAGAVALDLKVLEIDTSGTSGGRKLDSVEIHQLVFVKYEGEWVVVLQLARAGLVPESGSEVNAYQYVSYPKSAAGQMSREAAIQYVDAVLDLASQTQRL